MLFIQSLFGYPVNHTDDGESTNGGILLIIILVVCLLGCCSILVYKSLKKENTTAYASTILHSNPVLTESQHSPLRMRSPK